MEVDHFDPRRKDDPIQNYNNLFLATRHCNGAKRDYWPSEEDVAMGIRLLNPCEEEDYGVHICEDPVTRELVGTTVPGRNQVRAFDLNADHLVKERRDRTELRLAVARFRGDADRLKLILPGELLQKIEQAIGYMIPGIPPPR
jgi:hypothetical protein